MEKQYYVYVMSSFLRTLYIGITSDLVKRVHQHRNEEIEGFTKKYKVKRLVYYEATSDVNSAIEREKQLKRWRRKKKVFLIEKMNPGWKDLYEEII